MPASAVSQLVAESRKRQNLPPKIIDPRTLERVAALVASGRAER